MQEPQRLMGMLFIIAGLGYMLYVWMRQKTVQASQSWPSVSGKVTRSEVMRRTRMRQGTSSSTPIYSAKIEYTYVVDGEILSDDTICIGGELDTSGRPRAEARVEKYPEGSFVQVFYDPDDPKRACLERRGEIRVFGYLLGAFFAVMGLLMTSGIIFS